ncbi:TetR/AcrR family transcriptional regulator [Dictyobacter arantiisoli]|uniref:TetR family transcriptional regulator n=1 Tax=Dictyobacter arantiisoli TaxID=2014874 RepID=A0A5A5TEN8_9CHLR|nr:TetR/AcrR family transcriptional regulator [Dictyobacter arantiisoli]GCF09543.1 TetR family transcriptional regulator [Dictyobacter arantiisoli]
MSTRRRRAREQTEMKQNILLAARRIALEEGWQAVTTRKVAERIEYSQPTIYEYFANKEAILAALSEQGSEQILSALREARKQRRLPVEQLQVMSQAYWSFAFTCPELYQVMHGLAGVHFTRRALPEAARQTMLLVRETLLACPQLKPEIVRQPDDAIDAFWGLLHGLIILTMEGHITSGELRARLIMTRTLDELFQSWLQ